MNNMDRLIELLNKKNYSNKESFIKRLRIISSSVKDKINYTEDFINELNYLLAPEEKFNDEELQFLINFSSLGYSSKEYLLLELRPEEKNIFNGIENRILRSINFYRNRNDEINVSDLLRKLKTKKREFINNEEIDFIVKVVKENFSNKDLIDILKEINNINMNVFKKYELDLDYGMDEDDLEITNINIIDLEKLLLDYNIDFSLFSNELKNKLVKYGNLDKIKDILDFLKKEKLLDLKEVLTPDIMVRTFLYSNVKSLEDVKNRNNIDFIELVSKIPTVLYPTIKEKSKNVNQGPIPWDKTIRSGSMKNYNKNSDLLDEMGISFEAVWNMCYSFFIQSYKANKDSIDALRFYGIPIVNKDGEPRQMFSILGNRNPSVIDIYDLALECDAKKYALKAPSSLSPSQMYKFSLIKLAKKSGLSDAQIFGSYVTPNKEMYLKTKALSNYLGISKDLSIPELYEAVYINIPNQEIYDNIFEISNLNSLSDDILEDINIKALEKFSESEELYNFNGVKISKKKVLRRYLALKNNEKSNNMSALMYCITYGSLLDEKEFDNIYTLVKSSVPLKPDDDICAIKVGSVEEKSGGKSLNGGTKND